ncbi:MAG: hypothetical protein DRJ52_10920, partial [Thermoprotei archaeon]
MNFSTSERYSVIITITTYSNINFSIEFEPNLNTYTIWKYVETMRNENKVWEAILDKIYEVQREV